MIQIHRLKVLKGTKKQTLQPSVVCQLVGADRTNVADILAVSAADWYQTTPTPKPVKKKMNIHCTFIVLVMFLNGTNH